MTFWMLFYIFCCGLGYSNLMTHVANQSDWAIWDLIFTVWAVVRLLTEIVKSNTPPTAGA